MYITYKLAHSILQRSFIGPAGLPYTLVYPPSPATSLKPTYVGLLKAGSTLDQMRANTYTEVAGGTYARQPVTFNIPVLGSPTTSTNIAAPFPEWTKGDAEDWGTIKYIGLFNANVAGELLWFVEINPTINMTAGVGHVNTLTFPQSSSMAISFPGAGASGAPSPGFGKRFATILLNSLTNWGAAGSYYDDRPYWTTNIDEGGGGPYVQNMKMIMAHLTTNYTPSSESGGTSLLQHGIANPNFSNYDSTLSPDLWIGGNGPQFIDFTLDTATNPYSVYNATQITFAAATTANWNFGPNGGIALVAWYVDNLNVFRISHLIGFVPLPNLVVAAGNQLTFQVGSIRIHAD